MPEAVEGEQHQDDQRGRPHWLDVQLEADGGDDPNRGGRSEPDEVPTRDEYCVRPYEARALTTWAALRVGRRV